MLASHSWCNLSTSTWDRCLYPGFESPSSEWNLCIPNLNPARKAPLKAMVSNARQKMPLSKKINLIFSTHFSGGISWHSEDRYHLCLRKQSTKKEWRSSYCQVGVLLMHSAPTPLHSSICIAQKTENYSTAKGTVLCFLFPLALKIQFFCTSRTSVWHQPRKKLRNLHSILCSCSMESTWNFIESNTFFLFIHNSGPFFVSLG